MKEIAKVYSVGIKVLHAIRSCLEKNDEFGIVFEDVDESEGESFFWFAGIGLYAKVRVINGKERYFGKITWGRYTITGEEFMQEDPVLENTYEQQDPNEFWLFYKEGEADRVSDFRDEMFLYDNIWKVIEDSFPETNEDSPDRSGMRSITV